MKKLFNALLVCFLLAGCSTATEEAAVSTATPETTATPAPEATVEATSTPEPTVEATAETDEKTAFYASYPEDSYSSINSAVVKINIPSEGTSIIAGTMPDGTEMTQFIAEGLDYQSYTTTDGKTYIHYKDDETELTGWYTASADDEEEEDALEAEVETESTSFTLSSLTYVDSEGGLDHCTYEEDGTTYDAYFESDGDHRLVRLDYSDQDLQIDYVYDGLSIGDDLLNSEEITQEQADEVLIKAMTAMYGDDILSMLSDTEE